MTFLKYFVIAVIVLGLVGIGMFAFLSVRSHYKSVELGLEKGLLRACPNTPNCVNSENPHSSSYIKPLTFTDMPPQAWQRIKQIVRSLGGEIKTENSHYLHATFSTRIFRFVDDLELRMDDGKPQIHVRSASRVGRSDLGKNRSRVEEIRSRFNG